MRIVSALAISFAVALLPSAPAQAATPEDCQAAIAQTQTDLASVEIGGGNPERTRASLESKLTGALLKLEQDKAEDALDKLIDFRTSVEQLINAAKPKIGQEDANLLLADVNAAIACVEDLIAAAG